VTDQNSNAEAYQVMAEILVTVRRIVHRGLEKVAGKTWYLDGCPPGVFERLVDRKENEVAVDRFDREYQELISFASLDDLAEIVDYNEELADLLSAIEPEGTKMADRLRELEALRLKLAATLPFDQDDVDNLLDYHGDLRKALARGKKKNGEATPTPAPAAPVEESQEEESHEEESSEEKTPTETVDPDAPEFTTQAAKIDDIPSDTFGTVVSDADSDPVQEEGPAKGGDPAIDAEKAMASDDDGEVLSILRGEIMSVAEGVYQGAPIQSFPVWETLRASGWYDIKKADLALTPVELFYSIAGEASEKQRSGADAQDLKSFLEDWGFSKLLLSLREMFMRHNL
jgi:hypothetical protein